jgi:hypothetical protein
MYFLRFLRSIIEKKVHRRIFSVSLDHSDRSSGGGGGQQVSLVFRKLQLLQQDPELKLSGQPSFKIVWLVGFAFCKHNSCIFSSRKKNNTIIIQAF